MKNNSYVRNPVLATEDHAESGTTQSLSEDTCQRISSSEVVPSPTNQQQIDLPFAPAASEADSTSHEQILFFSQTTFEPAEELLRTAQSADVPVITEKKVTIASEAILDVERVSAEPGKETQVSQKIIETEIIPEVADSSNTTASLDMEILTSLLSPVAAPVDLVAEIEQVVECPLPTRQVTSQLVSEATTECPVPIQVAESVLQAEPKESVSEDPRPIIEAVVSSIIPPVQESAATISETPIEPGQTMLADPIILSQQLNGDDPVLQLGIERNPASSVANVIERNIVSLEANVTSASLSQNVASLTLDTSSSIQKETQEVDQPVQLEQKSEDSFSAVEPEGGSLSCVLEKEAELPAVQKTKLTVKLPPTEVSEDGTTSKTQALTSDSQISPVPTTKECPVRPNRSKDLKIPGTPIVIGPTPPTSPPLESEARQPSEEETQKQAGTETETQLPAATQVEALEETQSAPSLEAQTDTESQQTEKKVTRRMVKKSSAESDTPPESEGSSKKLVKKVVKKVVKKPKEGEEADGGSSTDKPKKVVKTVKKVAKTSSSTSLETDKSVPETPPPSTSSEVPVPPKRKVKSSSSAKPTVKKTDEPQ